MYLYSSGFRVEENCAFLLAQRHEESDLLRAKESAEIVDPGKCSGGRCIVKSAANIEIYGPWKLH